MNSETEIIKRIESLPEEELFDLLKNISKTSWDHCLDTNTICSWLSNFTGDCLASESAERNLALWLAINYVYYTDSDIRNMSENLWWKYLHHQLLILHNQDSNKSLDDYKEYILENTTIRPLGNCAGSGTNTAYFFRQSNRLMSKMFDERTIETYKYLLLIDDATLSGSQAVENIRNYSSLIHDKDTFVITFIATERAINKIKSEYNNIKVLSAIILDDRSKCFGKESYVFARFPEWKGIAKKMCRYYGAIVNYKNPLGYKHGQYMFGFFYNTPNNTLPIFWCDTHNWRPLFQRYYSDFDNKGVQNDEFFY